MTETKTMYCVASVQNGQALYWDGRKLSGFGRAKLYKLRGSATVVSDLKIREPSTVLPVTVTVSGGGPMN